MNEGYLQRRDAPFGDGVWKRIDDTVIGVAKARLAGRRLLEIDGPHGLALKAIGSAESVVGDAASEDVILRSPAMTPVPGMESAFRLSIRDIAAFEGAGQPLDMGPAARAAAACADQEDALVFNGIKSLALPGLLNARGVQTCRLTPWKEAGSAVANVLEGVGRLDQAGFQGPYALALAPALFNALFRRYPQGDQTELDHLRQVITAGIVKAAAVGAGGVLVTAVKELAAIVIGQDLATSFVGPEGRSYVFAVSETAALRLVEPASVCVLK